MSGGQEWLWDWTNERRKADGWISRGLLDTGGPDTGGGVWAAVRSAIYTLALEIYLLRIRSYREGLEVSGAVTSERAKAAVTAILERSGCAVRNNLEVTAPFRSATQASGTRGPAGTQLEDVIRLPEILPAGAPAPGEHFSFYVDLLVPPHGAETDRAVTVSGVDSGWTELAVTVQIVCDHIVFDAGGEFGSVLLLRDGSSRAARFTGRVLVDGGPTVRVKALFSHGGRHGGMLEREIPISGTASRGHAVPRPDAEPGGEVRLTPGAEKAKLVIRIIAAQTTARFTWSMEAPNDTGFGLGRRTGEIDLGTDSRGFAHQLLAKCPVSRPGRHASVLRGIGEDIWDAAPDEFRQLYAGMRRTLGPRFPIQIFTDEPHVPWEMMFPTERSGIEDPDHLYMTHPIARWFFDAESSLNNELACGRVATCVPDYPDGTLQAALEEGNYLVSEFAAERIEATHASWTGFWSDPPPWTVSVLHFAGHGSSGLVGGDPGKTGLKMLDGWVLPDEIHGGVTLGTRDGSFVVLNACSAAGADMELGAVGSLPLRLAKRNFRGIIAPVWAVQDVHASLVVREQLKLLRSGTDLGTSMLDARVAFRNASSTPYAYLCFGDVMARMDRFKSPPRPSPAPRAVPA